MKKIYLGLLFVFLSFFGSVANAQQENVWFSVDGAKIGNSKLQRKIQPKKYKTFELDLSKVKEVLGSVSYRSSSTVRSSALMSFPDEKGALTVFRIEESPVMHPDLAKRYPENRSFKGFAFDNSGRRVYFSYNENGLSALITDENGNHSSIEPLDPDHRYYKVYTRAALEGAGPLRCFTESKSELEPFKRKYAKQLDQGILKTYRLALAANGEYSQFHLQEQNATGKSDAEKKAVVLAALTTAVTKINAVLERDLAIHLQLVPDNDALIFLDAAKDPYDNNYAYPAIMLDQNQATCDKIIDPDNYDIGHVFTTTGGVAELRSICAGGFKAQGVSGSAEPVGETFYFDVVCHEIGHQLGANHTFNGSEDSCGLEGQRIEATAVEPGSGSTLMAYAGYCNSENLQLNSSIYFHGISIEEINNFLREGGADGCAMRTEMILNKNAPKVNAGSDRILPIGTPFKLTGEASDADGDNLTYCWEQIDAGITAVPPNGMATNGALYRSREPSPEAERYFPELKSLRNGSVSSQWEVTPQVSRELNFKLTVRDNHPEGGLVVADDVTFNVTDAAGPFLISSQTEEDIEWVRGNQETINWQVAGTDSNGIDVSFVNILLSTDGGLTFPMILASRVSNNGEQVITVPDIEASQCRIMVEAEDHVFFAVNTSNFSIGSFEKICENYVSEDIPRNIIFGKSNDVISLNRVEKDIKIEHISVAVRIKHTFISDLTLSLKSPSGTRVELLRNPCSFNDEDIDVTFIDKGEVMRCGDGSPAITGDIRALSALSQLNGENAKGIWKLEVADVVQGDDGILESWTLEICTSRSLSAVTDLSKGSFQIYPNPASGNTILRFDFAETGVAKASLYDLLGRNVYNRKFKHVEGKWEENIDLTSVTTGIYMLKVSYGDVVAVKKLILK